MEMNIVASESKTNMNKNILHSKSVGAFCFNQHEMKPLHNMEARYLNGWIKLSPTEQGQIL